MSTSKETGYDKISFARGTDAEIRAAIDKLAPYEPAISTDTDKFIFKTEDGTVKAITIGNDVQAALDTKLDKGSYTGAADTLFPKAGGEINGVMKIKMNSPYVQFNNTQNDPEARSGFIGCGSTAAPKDIQIHNDSSGKTLVLSEHGDLMYDSVKVYHQNNKPTYYDTVSMWKKHLGNVQFGLDGDINYAHLCIPSAAGSSGSFDVSIRGSWYNVKMGGTITVGVTYMISGAGDVNIATTRLEPTSTADDDAIGLFRITDPWYDSPSGHLFVTIYYNNPNQPCPIDVYVSDSNGATHVIDSIFVSSYGNTSREALNAAPYSGPIFYNETRTPSGVDTWTYCQTSMQFNSNVQLAGKIKGWNVWGNGWEDDNAGLTFTAWSNTGGGSLQKLVQGKAGGSHQYAYGLGMQNDNVVLYSHNRSSGGFELKAWHFNSSNGDFASPGNVIAYSDIKLKKDLEIIPNALKKIEDLNGYIYTRKDTGARQTGVVAQEVQAVLPEAVTESEGTLGVAYGNMVGLLIEGIKELRAEVKELKAQLEAR
ncbi:MAG: tail fiber domain-containing protein [Cetobacterium sp.]|uniref:tail fiber domain-containing protein n=1 Tax=Cetobacterium sp. TaxID=2071632 RepID=UPI003EE5105E